MDVYFICVEPIFFDPLIILAEFPCMFMHKLKLWDLPPSNKWESADTGHPWVVVNVLN